MQEVELEIAERLLQAQEIFSKGDVNAAREICNQILAAYPDQSNALHLLGILDYRFENFEEAANKIFKAIQSNPQNPYFFYNLGLILKTQEKLEEAFNFFQNALALKSTSSNQKKNSRKQSKSQNHLEVEAYQHSIASGQDPSYLAFHFHKEGKLEEAAYVYNQILKASPQNGRAQNDLGNILLEMGRLEEASICFRKAMEANPDLDQAPYNLANMLSEFGEIDESIKLYRQAIEINPNFFEAHFNLGLILEDLEFLDKAIESYREAIKINPKYAKAHYKVAGIFQKLKNFSQALNDYQRAVELDPSYSEAQYYFADLIKSQGDVEKAVEVSSKAFAVGEEYQILEGNIILETQGVSLSSFEEKDSIIATTKDEFLAAALTGKTPETTPPDYVRYFFDEFSKRFEEHLVSNLQYKVPQLMRDTCDAVLPTDYRFKNALDLGCGTGLSGESFISSVDRLSGVDLSSKMIEKAKEKKIYDAFYESDLLEFLSKSDEKFDLIIAADVLIYLGDPAPLFKSVQDVAEDGAIFVLSTENSNDGDYQIRQTGRYAHNNSFMEKLAEGIGFELLLRESVELRKEKEKWVDGNIFIFKYMN